MKKLMQDLAVIAAAAVLAAVGTGLVFAPSAADAEEELPVGTTIGGVVASVTIDPETAKEGKKPVLTVTATNPGKEKASVTAEVRIEAWSPESMLSRIPVMPKRIWTTSVTLELKAGETKKIVLNSTEAAPARSELAAWIGAPEIDPLAAKPNNP